jgi:hypothetical protein
MTVTALDLSGYVGAPSEDAAYVADCLATATALIDAYLRSQKDALVTLADAPVAAANRAIIDRAIKEVGAELYNRRDTKNGLSQFASTDGAAIRVARDPMIPGRAILAGIVGGGFA